MATIGLISLGCPRNLVDSEIMLGLLKKDGFKVTEDLSRCDSAVINTCSFIEDAKKESIDLILRVIDLKKENRIKSIIVAGCLPQRYPSELNKELKEIDAFIGTSDFIKLPRIVRDTLKGKRILEVSKRPSFLADHTHARSLITPDHLVYLKIAEGCNNRCSYCVIPAIRGVLRSRRMKSLLKETRALTAAHKISEINLIGQDTTLYGTDHGGKPLLSELLKKLAGLKAARWLRLLYTHPEHYTDELIAVIKNEPSICKYADLPLQHINGRVLKSMNRGINKKKILELISRLRHEIPGLAIRTAFIVGFPGETEKEFKELVEFIKDIKFERLGVFEYSREEGTRAYGFKGQIPEKVKQERLDVIMRLQQEISEGINAGYMGRELTALIDTVIARTPSEAKRPKQSQKQDCFGPAGLAMTYEGRTEFDAPEVDGTCFIRSKKRHKPGDFVRVKIIDTLEYDLVGEEK
ncbi:MAG: 30S ribosomal protein S12 methylthiotransferase RimO [Candidatus Omnitrophica bacterium]|nr:30S ribosomal protein S12 methylthiotransferase RimO [Candidatus Omnitrophota bacterium]